MKIVLLELRESDRMSVFIGREQARVSFFVTGHRRGARPEPHRHPYEDSIGPVCTKARGAHVYV